MDFFPPGKSKHIFWLKKLKKKSARHCSHCQRASSFSPRNGTESKDLATQPQRYFCLFGCETQLLHVIRSSFSEPAQPALLTPSLRKDKCGAAAGGEQGSGTQHSGFLVSPFLVCSFSFNEEQEFLNSQSWVLPSYSVPSLQEWSSLVSLEVQALEVRGTDSECKEQLWDPCSPPPPPAHPPGGTLGWAEPHRCFPRCTRYTSQSGASGKSSLSGQNHIGLLEIQCLRRQGREHRAQCRPLKGLQGPYLLWRKVPAGSHPWSPGFSLVGPRSTVGRLALGG